MTQLNQAQTIINNLLRYLDYFKALKKEVRPKQHSSEHLVLKKGLVAIEWWTMPDRIYNSH